MNINIDNDDDRMFRIGASNDPDSQQQQQLKSKTSMPTIYPNDYDFNVATGFGANSTTSRSFIRPTKNLSQQHRNISVPNSLKVPNHFYSKCCFSYRTNIPIAKSDYAIITCIECVANQ